MLPLPNLEDDMDEPYDVATRAKMRSRKKKVQDKWASMYFIPKDTLNMRNESSVVGRRGSRKGLQLYRDLSCKVCVLATVPHKRLGLAIHMQEFHKNMGSRTPVLTASILRANVLKTTNKTRSLSDSIDYSDLEIVEDDDNDIELVEHDTKNMIQAEGRNKLRLLDKIYNKDMVKKLGGSSVFQPEVSLGLKLTKAIKNENAHHKTPVVTPPSKIAEKISSMRDSFTLLLRENMKTNNDEDECVILEESSPPLHMSTPKLPNSNLKRKSMFLTSNTTMVPPVKRKNVSHEILTPRSITQSTTQQPVKKPEMIKNPIKFQHPLTTPNKSLTFQPEVSLSLDLTNAIRKSKDYNANEKNPAITPTTTIIPRFSDSTKTNSSDEDCEIIEEGSPLPSHVTTPVNPAKKPVGTSKRKLVFLTPSTTCAPQSKKSKTSPKFTTPDRVPLKKIQEPANLQPIVKTLPKTNCGETSKKKIDWRAVLENASVQKSDNTGETLANKKSGDSTIFPKSTESKKVESSTPSSKSKYNKRGSLSRPSQENNKTVGNEGKSVDADEEIKIVEEYTEYDVANLVTKRPVKHLKNNKALDGTLCSLEERTSSIKQQSVGTNDLVILDEEESNVDSKSKKNSVLDDEILLDEDKRIFSNTDISEEVVNLGDKLNMTVDILGHGTKSGVTDVMDINEEFEVVELLDDPIEPTVEELSKPDQEPDVVELEEEEADVTGNQVDPYSSINNDFIERLKAKLKGLDEKSPSKFTTTRKDNALTVDQNIVDCF